MSAPARAVFLSYAREDTPAARRIADALRAGGIEVWFDQSELRGGDAWDAKIKKQIQTCALFLPIISAQTQARSEGYFRLEWLLAAERTKLMGRSRAFLVPVAIDDTKEADADVPEAFLSVQWTRLGGDEVPAAFVTRVGRLLSPTPPGIGGPEPVAGSGATPAAGSAGGKTGSRRDLWLVLGGGIVALAVAGWFALRPAPAPSPGAMPGPGASQPSTESAAAKMAAKTIAVLPFENLSGDRANEYFSDGISGELLDLLSKVPDLRVAGRTSAFSFKGRQMTDAEIAQKLGVTYLVTGTVQTFGSQVRIAARLTSAADGFQLWSNSMTRELKDILAVQEEIAGLIAQNLQVTLGAVARPVKPVDPEAHRLVLEGRHHSILRTPEGLARAEEAFGQAIARDPEYAPALAGLAEVCVMRANYATQDGMGMGDVSADLRRARLEAQRAIAVDSSVADAHAVLGYCDYMEGDYAAADRRYRRSMELSPNRSLFFAWRAMLRLAQGRLEDGLKDMERTVTLDPLWPVSLANYADVLFRAGRPAEALQITERALNLRQGVYVPALGVRAQVLFALGRTEDAVAAARKIRAHLHQNPRRGADEAAIWVLSQTGQAAEAEAYREEYFRTLPALSQQRGYVLAALGRFGEALPFLEWTPSSVRRRLYWDPIWDRWREDPRFRELMEKLGSTAEYRTAREEWTRLRRTPSAKR